MSPTRQENHDELHIGERHRSRCGSGSTPSNEASRKGLTNQTQHTYLLQQLAGAQDNMTPKDPVSDDYFSVIQGRREQQRREPVEVLQLRPMG